MKQRMLWGSAPAAAAHDEPDWGMYGPCSAPPTPLPLPLSIPELPVPRSPGHCREAVGTEFPRIQSIQSDGIIEALPSGTCSFPSAKGSVLIYYPLFPLSSQMAGQPRLPCGLQRPSGPDLTAADGANPRAAEDLQGLSRVGALCLYRVLALIPHTTQSSTHR